MTGKPVFAASEREKVLFPDPAIPVTITRRPTPRAGPIVEIRPRWVGLPMKPEVIVLVVPLFKSIGGGEYGGCAASCTAGRGEPGRGEP
jgi:hypothetical protein